MSSRNLREVSEPQTSSSNVRISNSLQQRYSNSIDGNESQSIQKGNMKLSTFKQQQPVKSKFEVSQNLQNPLQKKGNMIINESILSSLKKDEQNQHIHAKEKVHFEETVFISQEEFRNNKARNWSDIKNLKIQSEFSVFKTPEGDQELKNQKKSGESDQYQEEMEGENVRKMKNKQQIDKIQYKKVIGGLDLWQSQMKQKKRSDGMSGLLFVKDGEGNDRKIIIDDVNDTPEINVQILNSIIQGSNRNTESDQEGENENIQNNVEENTVTVCSIEEIDDPHPSIKKNDPPKKIEEKKINPTSSNFIQFAPITLTSSKMKKPITMKNKAISRYLIDEETKAVITKTDAQVQAEQNHIIINQIFKKKLIKAMDSNMPTTKGEYFDLVRNQSAMFKQDVLSKFKSLNYINNKEDKASQPSSLSNPRHPKYSTIEYEELYKDLFEGRILKKGPNLEDEQKDLQLKNSYSDEHEKAILKKYKQAEENCKSASIVLNQLRQSLSNNQRKIQDREQEYKMQGQECNRQIYYLEREGIQSEINQIENHQKNPYSSVGKKENPYKDQILHAKENKEQILNTLKQQLTQLNEQAREIDMEVQYKYKEYNSAKEQKNSLKHMLKEHYFQGMKQTSKKSLIYIIIKLFLIKEEVTYNIFPDYLDEKDIEFLLEYARLELKLQEMRIKIKSFNKYKTTVSYNFDEVFSKLMQSKSDVNKQLKVLPATVVAQTSISLVSSPEFNGAKINIFQKQKSDQVQQNDFTERRGYEDPTKQVLKLEEDIKQVECDVEKLKEKEVEKLYSQSLKESFFIKDILFSLFGQDEGQKYQGEFERRKQKMELQLANNKTFYFSSAINLQQSARKKSATPKNSEKKNDSLSVQNDTCLKLTETTLEPIKQNQILLGIRRSSKRESLSQNLSSSTTDGISIFLNPQSNRSLTQRKLLRVSDMSASIINSDSNHNINNININNTNNTNKPKSNSITSSLTSPISNKRIVSFSHHSTTNFSSPKEILNSSKKENRFLTSSNQSIYSIINNNNNNNYLATFSFSSPLSSPRLSVQEGNECQNFLQSDKSKAKSQFKII